MDDTSKARYVYSIFQSIAKNYDRANDRISLGFQHSFKKMLTDRITRKIPHGGKVLDVCCGTGDIAITVAEGRRDLKVTGLDFSPAMLRVARMRRNRSCHNLRFKQGDAMDMPFEDQTFDAVCISFGLRNTGDYFRVLNEMRRVTKEGGYVYCLDSLVPESRLIKPVYTLYFRYIMPFLGGGISRRKAYMWLYHSTRDFLTRQELIRLFVLSDLKNVRDEERMFGACVLVQGQK